MHYSPDVEGCAVLADMLDSALGLKRQLAGVTFLRRKEDFDNCELTLARTPLTYCSLVRMATTGRARKASAAQISCPGARRALGMEPVNEEFLSGERYMSLGLYEDTKRAGETARQISIMEGDLYGVAVQPLRECTTPPDVVICIASPKQIMRLVQGHIYGSGPLDPMQAMGMQGLCAELTVRPHLSGAPNVSLLCSNTRYTCAWGEDELGVGLPYQDFSGMVRGVLETLDFTESDSDKDIIARRAKDNGHELNIRLGAAYYLKDTKAGVTASKPLSSKHMPGTEASDIQMSGTQSPDTPQAPDAKPNADDRHIVEHEAQDRWQTENVAPTKNTPERPLSIKVRGVSKAHVLKCGTHVHALENVSLDVREQEFLTLVGPSGCGKSTLLNLMAGLTKPDAGSISMHGRNKDRDTNLGFISQVDTLLPWRTVTQNVEMGLELRKVSKRERREKADKLMDQVGLLEFAHSYPFELSGGMKKRAAVIRALAYDPDIIFMDEPFVGLDVQTRDELEEDILHLWQTHRKTIVMVTHDLSEAITLSDRVVLLSHRPARVQAEYDIPLPRPRSVMESKFSEEFIALHKRIWDDLSAEVQASNDRRNHA